MKPIHALRFNYPPPQWLRGTLHPVILTNADLIGENVAFRRAVCKAVWISPTDYRKARW